MAQLLPILRALPALAALTGLSAAARVRLKLDRFVAPLAAANFIILFMLIAALLGLLKPGCLALYALGIAGLIYAWFVKRSAPSMGLLLALLLFAAFLAWRFRGCKLYQYDDFSHWGTLTRFMMLTDRLPTAADDVISHQSYPPGSACFIYFFARLIGPRDEAYLVAQNLLHGVALLPVFSCIRADKRRLLDPVAGLMLFALLFYPCRVACLLVDDLQLFYGIGAAAITLRYRDEPRRALLAALPALTCVALFKNSGLFFALTGGAMLAIVARRKLRGARLRLCTAAALLAPALAYLLWLLCARIRFPAVEASAHSFSPSLYMANLAEKGAGGVRQVAGAMFAALCRPGGWRWLALAALLPGALALLVAALRLPAPARRGVCRAAVFAAACYAAWLLLLFGMYVFSMSGAAAAALSSFNRYNATGYSYALGLLFLVLLLVLQRDDLRLPRWLPRAGSGLCAAALAVALALALIPGGQTPLDAEMMRPYDYIYLRRCLTATRQLHDLPYGERCLVFYLYDNDYSTRADDFTRLVLRYEFGTDGCPAIAAERNSGQMWAGVADADSAAVRAYLAENIDGCAALILLDEYPPFEAELERFLADYAGNTPVYRAYEEIELPS